MEQDQQRLTAVHDVELARWTELVSQGTQNAVSGLSEMLGSTLRMTAIDLRVVPVEGAAELLGGPENEVVGVYLTMNGGATGHIMLVYPVEVAFRLIDTMLFLDVGTTQEMGEMEESALAELGNITGSYFLNSVADNTGMRLTPSPPTVILDMAGAILNVALADIMQDRDEMFAMQTIFSSDDAEVTGVLLVLPTADFMDVMMEQNSKFARVSWQ